jgi:hypothetical protein
MFEQVPRLWRLAYETWPMIPEGIKSLGEWNDIAGGHLG